ncbi:MAG: hypothetical protein LLG20_05915 [Acidobacteriales bacterium]|nr:hypothetical protein [Terriglobales bacterium]
MSELLYMWPMAIALGLGCLLLWLTEAGSKSAVKPILYVLGILSLILGMRGLMVQLRNIQSRIEQADAGAHQAYHLQAERAIRDILAQPSRSDLRRLGHFEHRVFSQNGEDGIIMEIFRRIGTTDRSFVEFGASDGSENNTVLLLTVCGWRGVWMDGDSDAVELAGRRFANEVNTGRLRIKRTFITAGNIEGLFREMRVPQEFDLLSVDIDRNDYYVWKGIKDFRPRVVVIEYNPLFPPYLSWVVPYDANAMWDGTSHTGASLKALEELGSQKGYKLVGCSLAGVNAFFVRDDCVGDRFVAPFTAENHYEPARYPLDYFDGNHRRKPWHGNVQ